MNFFDFLPTKRNKKASFPVKELLKLWISGNFFTIYYTYICSVNLKKSHIKGILAKKLTVVVVLLLSAAAAFATLGDGKTKSSTSNKSLLSSRSYNQGVFSLKSGYHFRGDKVISPEQPQYININTTVTRRKGNVTYIVPLKKSVLFNKVKFNF